uniref:FP protein C-terminal domain-containing protein n=1 Tax=Heliothis virescens TaxID=7102 RepID=A0A2A4JHC8_HELVI
MPRVQRSPPTTPLTEIHRARSSPDMTDSQKEPETDFINRNARNQPSKRLRPDFSPENAADHSPQSFEEKIMNMLTAWKKEQDTMLKSLSSDILEVKQQNREIQKINIEIEKSIENINLEYESMRQLIGKLEKDRAEQCSYIAELERRVLDLENSCRPATIEIRNVPFKEAETSSELTSIVIKTCTAIQAGVNESQIRDVYRLPGKKELNRPIVVEFLTVPVKDKVLGASRAFNKDRATADKLNTGHIGYTGIQKPIYVAEHLPTSMRKLFYEARNFANTNTYKFCWFQNGKIFLRKKEGDKSVVVSSMSSLKELQKPLI